MKKTMNKDAHSAQPAQATNRTDKQQQAAERREWLRNISARFQSERDLLIVMGKEAPSINEMLRRYYKTQNAVTDLRTYDQWKKDGYQVRKGEKAYLVWGKPKTRQEEPTDDNATQEEPNPTHKDEFYPVCYLFDIAQCQKA